jgi:hypothetical protein
MFRPRSLAIFTLSVLLTAQTSVAKSVKDFEAMSTPDQSAYLLSFLDKMTSDLARTNEKLAQDIRNYFFVKQGGKPLSEGMERVFVELTALERAEKAGKADLTKIQIETIIVYVVKQKFPPPAR